MVCSVEFAVFLYQKSCAKVFLQTGKSESLLTYSWISNVQYNGPEAILDVAIGRGKGVCRCRTENWSKQMGRQASRGSSGWHWGQMRRTSLPVSPCPGPHPSHHPVCPLKAPLWKVNLGPRGDVSRAMAGSLTVIGFLSCCQREFTSLSVT